MTKYNFNLPGYVWQSLKTLHNNTSSGCNVIFTRNVNNLSPLTSAFNSNPSKLINVKFLKNKEDLTLDRTLPYRMDEGDNPRIIRLANQGLFGITELFEPEGFYLLKENAIAESDKLLQECCSSNRERKMVEVFDHLSNSLCKVADLAEFIRMTHPNFRFSNAAENACIAIGGLVEKLNTHRPLYEALHNVVINGDIVSTTQIDDHVAKLFLFDFEQSGIHLNESNRLKVAELNELILTLGQKFLNGTSDPRAILKEKLPEAVRHHFPVDGKNVIVSGMFTDHSMEIVREAAYKIFLYPEEIQKERFENLIETRHQMATLCGFPSLAHRAMRGSLAETPDLVNGFLSYLTKEIKSEADKEFDEMRALKKSYGKSSKQLAPWDVSYYSKAARSKILPRDVKDSISAYFSLGTVMEGLCNLYKDLFNISLKVEETKQGELWTPNVYKIAVMLNSNDLLGYIYCDFFEHPHKAHQDCHFTIRGGKVLADGTYQNPIVVLHLNFPSPSWSSPCLLSLSMVENLFHEMGHAMHSMIARTRYQHVTGTRCSTDFAEVPSLLMEFFANDARVLHRIACHYKTGEKLKLETIEQILASNYVYSAVEMQLQTFYSHLDQRFHGSERWPRSVSSMDILAETQNSTYGLPYVPNTAWHLRFGHLVGYGAKYYSYLMSRAVASWIWQKYFSNNPFNRDAGEKLCNEVLRHGGGKPPQSMVEEFLGKKVTSENLVSALMTDLHTRKERMLAADKRR